jgi:hypothetical protein
MKTEWRKISRLILPIGWLIFSSAVYADAQKMKTIKIYLQKYDTATNSENLEPVLRQVNGKAQLSPTLAISFRASDYICGR